MSITIPEESPLADHKFVNVGLQNWLAIRSEWREYPEDFDPSKIVRVDPTNLDKNQIYNVISGQQPYRMPLSTLISALTLVWDELMN